LQKDAINVLWSTALDKHISLMNSTLGLIFKPLTTDDFPSCPAITVVKQRHVGKRTAASEGFSGAKSTPHSGLNPAKKRSEAEVAAEHSEAATRLDFDGLSVTSSSHSDNAISLTDFAKLKKEKDKFESSLKLAQAKNAELAVIVSNKTKQAERTTASLKEAKAKHTAEKKDLEAQCRSLKQPTGDVKSLQQEIKRMQAEINHHKLAS
jgi:hypothetical protein